MSARQLVACHECDLLQQVAPLPPRAAARCVRCGAMLHRTRPNSIERTLALVISGLILFSVANSFPFLAFDMQGQETQTKLITGVIDLYRQGMLPLAAVVLLTSVAAPLLQLLGLLYVLLPLKLGRTPWLLVPAFRLVSTLAPWAMMEVFLLGILVSVVKLAGMASIIPGIALWAFALLILVLAAAGAALDSEEVWERLEAGP